MTATATNQQYTFYIADNTPLAIANPELELKRDGIKISSCRLKFQLDYQTYNQIIQASLFNLPQQTLASLDREEFDPEQELSLRLELKPSFLSQITKLGNQTEIDDYLSSLEFDSEAIADSILYTENWYCLSIEQGQINYYTLWHHANPTTLDRAANSSKEALQGVFSFLQEAMASYQASLEVQTANQVMERELSQILQPLTDRLNNTAIEPRPVSQVMLDFFVADNWDYYWWQPGETLQLQCQTPNGRLTCYARAIDDRQQFIFYTLCPLNAPESRMRDIAELIIKANYGMAIGNFELDFTDGEIRYKTSMDVEGDRLSQALIKQAVYLNVLTMDRYLPIISAVIEGTTSVDEAMALAEP